ncbi:MULTISPECIES: rRNA maturation RNase YbeY [Brevibacillus]|uniref:Endoribonuclease YbeY n=1 Tax=Brevibacillus laterosporus TaxID=1465 RepID=A0AAP8Q9T0_BRELA|nr:MULTISPECIES: rRNA maturation RNase YbeY [Brevibacillus]ATO50725.1 rRNA maturation RNase YbeY [Brevibacillus laterosporus DSM 25]AYB39070.1 rRNA maturation RNase YbeY [Brevibacillus laterosporus]MBG9773759.1 rRNA maturation factor [Brevibacillus laterosporus]MBG9790714.1 rRNA maturation factor [Brevibacillus laterosporus]MBG9797981.1 rRNA maturation factor [Brevibacillus laterosporus]
MLTIEIVNEQDEEITQEHQQLIEECLQKAAQFEEITGEVVITLVNNERIHELNRDYRGVDRPTDVLSFALNEEGEGDMEIFVEESEFDDYPNMLGDIIISIPRTKEQAQDYGHSFERELGFLAVHGFLHLIGYDHGTPEEEKEMFTRQENILQEVGLTR